VAIPTLSLAGEPLATLLTLAEKFGRDGAISLSKVMCGPWPQPTESRWEPIFPSGPRLGPLAQAALP
jgi:hypothetical protein